MYYAFARVLFEGTLWLGLWMSIKLTRTTLFNLNNSIFPGIIIPWIILTPVEAKTLRS